MWLSSFMIIAAHHAVVTKMIAPLYGGARAKVIGTGGGDMMGRFTKKMEPRNLRLSQFLGTFIAI